MEYHISDRIASLKPSAIREIFKFASDPSVISLAGGDPAYEALPLALIRTLLDEALEKQARQALLYSQSEGYPPLRQALREYLGSHGGVFRDGDDVMVTTGAQQCMDLSTKVLCNEGDTVIVEDPSFIGALNCFRSYNVNLVGVPLEDDGIDLEKLEQALRANPNTRFIYLIPNFQNPTGITTSLEKRRAVYALARKFGVLILEDNPYGDLRFEGEAVPSIKSMDEDGRVIYVGSFSKILSTGIRIGYIVVPQGLFGRLVVAKQCTDVHTSMPIQLLCHKFLTQGGIDAHIEGIRGIYAHKCRHMLREMDGRFPGWVRYTRPSGGIFVWVGMPGSIDGNEYATRLVKEHKVCVVPGSAFSAQANTPSSAFRMNFTASTDEQIAQGVDACAKLLHAMI